jgi:hypothetical protein
MTTDIGSIYTPLDPTKAQIRSVTLQPASSRKDVVRCDLSINSLDEPGRPPVYEALSYEWGLPESHSFIVLNGRRTQVRENLHQALLHLRYPAKERTLWVDALCIRQDDIDERNHQVQQMGRIFMRATKVVSWLGLDDEWTGTVMELLRRAGAPHFAGNLRKLNDWKRPEYAYKYWHALKHFCSMTYWDRLWISQEIALAREIEIHCGNMEISWSFVARTINRVKAAMKLGHSHSLQIDITHSTPAGFVEARQVREAGGGEPTQLHNLCQLTENARCCDPRDKVFGLLSIATHVGGRLQVDYNKSLYGVFEDVMLFHYRMMQHPRYNVVDMVQLAFILQRGFYQSLSTSTALPDEAELMTLLRQPRIEKGPTVSVSIEVMGSIVCFQETRFGDICPGLCNHVISINSTVCFATEGSIRRKTVGRGGSLFTNLEHMIVNFSDTASSHRVMTFGFNAAITEVWGIAPVESQNGDLLAKIDYEESWVLLRSIGDSKYKLIGRAVLLENSPDETTIPGWPHPLRRKLSLVVSIAVLQLLCETNRINYTELV